MSEAQAIAGELASRGHRLLVEGVAQGEATQLLGGQPTGACRPDRPGLHGVVSHRGSRPRAVGANAPPGNRETRPGPIMWRDAHVPRVSRCAYSGKTPETARKTCPRLLPVEIGPTAWRWTQAGANRSRRFDEGYSPSLARGRPPRPRTIYSARFSCPDRATFSEIERRDRDR